MTLRVLYVCTTKYVFQDPFGDVIKKIMNAIHTHAELTPTCELGSQNYEQWVVQKERTGEHNFSSSGMLALCPTSVLFFVFLTDNKLPGLWGSNKNVSQSF